jgi:hypothetical protein
MRNSNDDIQIWRFFYKVNQHHMHEIGIVHVCHCPVFPQEAYSLSRLCYYYKNTIDGKKATCCSELT